MFYTAKLRNWTLVPTSIGVYCLGNVYEDRKERFNDGQLVRTSSLTGLPVEKDGKTYVCTRNSVYLLDGPERPMEKAALSAY